MNMKESLVKRYMAGVRERKGGNIVIFSVWTGGYVQPA